MSAKSINERRIKVGRLAVYIEPRDAWVGLFVSPSAVYLLLVPFLVFRWERSQGQARAVSGP